MKKIESEFDYFFIDLYKYIIESLSKTKIVNPENIKKIVVGFATMSQERYYIKMKLQYKKFIRKKNKVKKDKLFQALEGI